MRPSRSYGASGAALRHSSCMGWCEAFWADHRTCTGRAKRGFLTLLLLTDALLLVASWQLALVLADPIQPTGTRVVCLLYIPCSVLVPALLGWNKSRTGASRERAITTFAYSAFGVSVCASLIGVAASAF
jgi:hypothetical protein